MTTTLPDTPHSGPANTPLVLKLTEELGPLPPPLPRKKQAVFHHPMGMPLYDGMAMGLHALTYAEPLFAEIERLRAKVANLTLYENMAKEFGLSAFPDCAAWQQTLEAIAEGRVMPRDGTHTHAEAVVAYQALARQALAGADHFGDANKMVLGPNAEVSR